MATLNIFVSFEFDKDNNLKNNPTHGDHSHVIERRIIGDDGDERPKVRPYPA